MFRWLIFPLISVLIAAHTAIASPLFQGIGVTITNARGVSGDGSTVVGAVTQTGVGEVAYRWTVEGGVTLLDVLPGWDGTAALGVSYDGSAIVGVGQTSDTGQTRPFRWTSTAGMVALSHPSWADGSRASSVSDDGAIVGGHTIIGGSTIDPIRWGPAGSATLIGESIQGASIDAVSGDGTTFVGASTDGSGSPVRQVTKWTPDGQFRLGLSGTARGVSQDGSIIIGKGEVSPNVDQAFLWESGVFSFLGALPGGTQSQAYDVTSDGTVVVGGSDSADGQRAFIWSAELGMLDLAEFLTDEFGMDLTGWTLGSAQAISDDGLVIAGNGFNPSGQSEAWVAIIPEPSTASLLGLGLVGVAAVGRRRTH